MASVKHKKSSKTTLEHFAHGLIVFLAIVIFAACGLHLLQKRISQPPKMVLEPVVAPEMFWIEPVDPGYLRGFAVCLDPGHGFEDVGAVCPYWPNVYEKDITLSVTKKLAALLEERGCRVVLTTEESDLDATVLTQSQRVSIANGDAFDLFLSIHCNAFPEDPSVNGLQLYYCQGKQYDDSALCADLATTLEETLRKEAYVFEDSPDRAYQVTREVQTPAVLLELGFLTNLQEAENLMEEAYQTRLAKALLDGIILFLKPEPTIP